MAVAQRRLLRDTFRKSTEGLIDKCRRAEHPGSATAEPAMTSSDDHPLRERLGVARGVLPWVRLGHWPTAITPLVVDGVTIWIKREDLSHPRYGGNKVRTLETLLGDAAARGVTRVWAAGAYGSNHAVATMVHASTAGLAAGALLFPQPYSATAAANLRSSLSLGGLIVPVRSVATLPMAMFETWRRDRRAGQRPWMMPPGGASPLGTLGALSAVFELAEQLQAHLAPPPLRIFVAAGSTCTTAGILAGLALAHRVGRWPWPRPLVHSVRVTPWPVTSRYRISALAKQSIDLADRLRCHWSGIGRAELAAYLIVDGSQLGAGYGRSTMAGEDACRGFANAGGPTLDSVYTAKSVAALRSRLRAKAGDGPCLLWSTKSASPAPLDPIGPSCPQPFARWLGDRDVTKPAP